MTPSRGRLENMDGFRVTTTADPVVALEKAAGYLGSDPVGLNVIWSILASRAGSGIPGLYWLFELGDRTTGVVLESPPGHPAAISPMSPENAAAMAEAIANEAHELSGIAGEASAAAAFAGKWTEHKAVAAEVAEAQRLYVLAEFVPPVAVPGRLRRAEMAERAIIIKSFSQFQVETGAIHFDVSGAVDSGLSSGRLFVWDDDGARCIARATEPLGAVSRIGIVYTPQQWRRKGYAAACVGALCEWERAEEGANAVLYAQLRNPGSNAIYRRLGFRAVSEVLSYDFAKVIENR